MAAKRTTAPDAPDHVALLAQLRQGDEAAVARAYKDIFGTPIGRLVLMHLASANGVGAVRGPGLSPADRAYHDGRSDAALEIIATAGFDQASVAVMVIADNLEGQEHDDRDTADPEFG